jgi:hypothetical protein
MSDTDDIAEPTGLEQRYRRVLRLLPASYREVWEEDMVATFLAAERAAREEDPEHDPAWADDFGRPPFPEVASVALLAARLRLGFGGTPPRAVAWGGAARLLALMSLLVYAVFGLIGIGLLVWQAGRIPGAPPPEWAVGLPRGGWEAAWVVLGLAWLPAYFALLAGRYRVAQVLALVGFGVNLLSAGADVVSGKQPHVTSGAADLLLNLLVVLALGAFHREAPPVRQRPWLLALPFGVALAAALLYLGRPVDGRAVVVLDWFGLHSIAIAVAGVAYLAGAAAGVITVTARWAVALATLAAAVFALRSLTLADYVLSHHDAQFFEAGGVVLTARTLGLLEAPAALAVAEPLTGLAARALRRLPPGPAAAVLRCPHSRAAMRR